MHAFFIKSIVGEIVVLVVTTALQVCHNVSSSSLKTLSTLQSIEIDLSRSAYSDTFSVLLNELETSYLDNSFQSLVK